MLTFNNIKKYLTFLTPGIFQFSIAFFLLIFILLYDAVGLPSTAEISKYFLELYESYGLIIIIVASFLEGLFMISMYLPASLVIVLSAFALGFDINNLTVIGILSLIGFTAANILNYYLGKYGYYKILLKLGGKKNVAKIQSDFTRNQIKTIFLTSFHPNLLAITMVSAGVSSANIRKVLFYSILSLLFWITLWMIVITLLFKEDRFKITENEYFVWYFMLVLILWGLLKCLFEYAKKYTRSLPDH